MVEKVVITGSGQWHMNKTSAIVSVYNMTGWIEDWPSMKYARFYHGCGHYVNNENEKVDLNFVL